MNKDFKDYPKAFLSDNMLFTYLNNTGYFVRARKSEVNHDRIDNTLLKYGKIFEDFRNVQGIIGGTRPDFYYHNRLNTGYLLKMSTVLLGGKSYFDADPYYILEREDNSGEVTTQIIQLENALFDRKTKDMRVWDYDERGNFSEPRIVKGIMTNSQIEEQVQAFRAPIKFVMETDPFLSIASSTIPLY